MHACRGRGGGESVCMMIDVLINLNISFLTVSKIVYKLLQQYSLANTYFLCYQWTP